MPENRNCGCNGGLSSLFGGCGGSSDVLFFLVICLLLLTNNGNSCGCGCNQNQQ